MIENAQAHLHFFADPCRVDHPRHHRLRDRALGNAAVMDNALLYFAIVLVAGGFIAWLANAFTITIPMIAKNLYLMLVLGFLVYLVISFVRTA